MRNFFRTLLLLAFCLNTANALAEKINLLPHQQKVVSYLNENNSQHGLLLYHALGSGKTITSLSYAKSSDKKTIILVPEVLKAHWINEIEKLSLDSKDFQILSYNDDKDLNEIINIDYSNNLVLVDEIQKLIEFVRVTPDQRYLNLYWKLIKSHKIIALTGTPVFNDATDIAFIGNLLIGEEHFPFHPDVFKAKYMRINTATSLFRGYLTESKLMAVNLPLFSVGLAITVSVISGSGLITTAVAMAGSAALNLTNEQYPINKVSFREFDANLFSNFSSRYISFYKTEDENLKDYPEVEVIEKKVHYSNSQVSFFMNFVDGMLHADSLKMLLKDYPIKYSESMLYLSGAKIQQDILARNDSGREIGNLSLQGENSLEISPKFIEIEKVIRKNKGKTAVYSSYFHNGIELFAEFLKERSYSFEILQPKAGIKEITRVLKDFNSGKNKILLIHPEITEGISLEAVEQFHILEPVKNLALEKQIIGRSVRYHSHLSLPKERRKVEIYLWESTVIYDKFFFPTDAGLVRRDHWRKSFGEVNPNLWTNGITQLDPQFFKKDETPDFRVNKSKDRISGDMNSFEQVCKNHALENGPLLNSVSSENSTVQMSSLFAVPQLSFNRSENSKYNIYNAKNNKKVFDKVTRISKDFAIEIPHNNNLNVGFGLRLSTGEITIAGLNAPTVDSDFGFYTRLHKEFESLDKLSFFWKNEGALNIYAVPPSVGLGLNIRESLGLQLFVTKHFGLNIEMGFEGRLMKDTILSQLDELNKDEIIAEESKKISLMRSVAPFVSFGIFSTYF